MDMMSLYDVSPQERLLLSHFHLEKGSLMVNWKINASLLPKNTLLGTLSEREHFVVGFHAEHVRILNQLTNFAMGKSPRIYCIIKGL